jgi:hypothetical protein
MDQVGTAKNLPEGIVEEIRRCERLLETYRELPNNAGAFTMMFIKQAIECGQDALASGNAIECLKSYEELRQFKE